MVKLLPRYPAGLAGVALLLLRLSCALVSVPSLTRLIPALLGGWSAYLAGGALIFALVGGILTRSATLLLLGIIATDMMTASGEAILFLVAAAASAAALVLLGPGAYSVDAQRFGRRVIRVDPRPPRRGPGSPL